MLPCVLLAEYFQSPAPAAVLGASKACNAIAGAIGALRTAQSEAGQCDVGDAGCARQARDAAPLTYVLGGIPRLKALRTQGVAQVLDVAAEAQQDVRVIIACVRHLPRVRSLSPVCNSYVTM